MVPEWLPVAPGQLVFLVISSQKVSLRTVPKLHFEWTGLPMNIEPNYQPTVKLKQDKGRLPRT